MLRIAQDSERQRQACEEIIRQLTTKLKETANPEEIKLTVARRYGLSRIPSSSEILSIAPEGKRETLDGKLRLKRIRAISGVHVIGVMAAPQRCPHGRCAYCPQENDAPMSYTGYEPAAMRAKQNNFDPYKQLTCRLSQLRAIGHRPSKVELVVQGGTFLASPSEYQRHFLKRCLDALNGRDGESLEDAKRTAEFSALRNVGLTFETRPDWAQKRHVDTMLTFGATRVEIGVQSLDENVLRLVGREHSVDDVVDSFRIAKDAGLKVVAHMMPGLPGSNPESDLDNFRELFCEPRFRPDMLKIYPCLVVRGTKVFDWWKSGKYSPLDTEHAAELVANVKELTPPWVRIMRVQREIPAGLIVAGPNKGNLRERAHAVILKRGAACRCIRCREVGHRRIRDGIEPNQDDVKLVRRSYDSSDGKEVFLSEEDLVTDTLVAYLRLRIPSPSAHRPEVNLERSSIVRELRVCGPMVPVGERDSASWQHRGYGTQLLGEAERLCKEEYDVKKILVLSALGTKQYYSHAGYVHDGPYMSKHLDGP